MWQMIIGGLLAAAPKIVFTVLKALGIGLITYTGLTLFANQLESLVSSYIGGLTADIYAILGLCGGITGLNILVAGYASAATIKATRSTLGIVGDAT